MSKMILVSTATLERLGVLELVIADKKIPYLSIEISETSMIELTDEEARAYKIIIPVDLWKCSNCGYSMPEPLGRCIKCGVARK